MDRFLSNPNNNPNSDVPMMDAGHPQGPPHFNNPSQLGRYIQRGPGGAPDMDSDASQQEHQHFPNQLQSHSVRRMSHLQNAPTATQYIPQMPPPNSIQLRNSPMIVRHVPGFPQNRAQIRPAQGPIPPGIRFVRPMPPPFRPQMPENEGRLVMLPREMMQRKPIPATQAMQRTPVMTNVNRLNNQSNSLFEKARIDEMLKQIDARLIIEESVKEALTDYIDEFLTSIIDATAKLALRRGPVGVLNGGELPAYRLETRDAEFALKTSYNIVVPSRAGMSMGGESADSARPANKKPKRI